MRRIRTLLPEPLTIGGDVRPWDRSGQLHDRFRFETYRSGHMMYLREEDQESSNQHIREFIEWATPPDGMPALHGRALPVVADDIEEQNP
ncbi:MAG: hypothetical protein WD960_08905 [Gemmatimonadota bacterium]